MNKKYIVKNCTRFTHAGCIGIEGIVLRKENYNGKTFYDLEATNDGPFITASNAGKAKNIRLWKKGNHAYFLKSELELLN